MKIGIQDSSHYGFGSKIPHVGRIEKRPEKEQEMGKLSWGLEDDRHDTCVGMPTGPPRKINENWIYGLKWNVGLILRSIPPLKKL